jgi:hypothetical protein
VGNGVGSGLTWSAPVGGVGSGRFMSGTIRIDAIGATLRKIEAWFSGAGTAGERLAAEATLERVRAKLHQG